MKFNPAPSAIMHIDLNSCFASVEQQANPNLRGRPIAVAAYTTPNGCILAASIEAKKLGIKTGLRIKEGKMLCPNLVVLSPDTDKYRFIHLQFHKLLSKFSPKVIPKSIDEFVLDFHTQPQHLSHLFSIGRQIKSQIKSQIGDWLTVSIGIGPNRFLAKMASNLKKPDGLEEICLKNYLEVYSKLEILDLHGINTRLNARLSAGKIFTVLDFLKSDICHLKSVFHSIASYYWYLRLRGYEIDDVDFGRKSFGHMYSLPKHLTSSNSLAPILHRLVSKMGYRLRNNGYQSRGFYLGLLYTDHSYWHQHRLFKQYFFADSDLYRCLFRLLQSSPQQIPIANLAISCFDLMKNNSIQLDLFSKVNKNLNISRALDSLNKKYGSSIINYADFSTHLPDRIGFGNFDRLTDI